MMRLGVTTALVVLLIASPRNASAHDVPDNVSIQMFLQPAGGRLQALVRMPVKALIDIEFPQLPGTGFLDLPAVGPTLAAASKLWVSDLLTLYEDDARLPNPTVVGFVLSRDMDPSFNSYAFALAHVEGPALPANTLLDRDRATLDVLLETPIHSDQSDFSLLPRWGRLGIRVMTTVGFLPPNGGMRTFEYEGDPGLYRLNPQSRQAAVHFIQRGLEHMLDQPDHLLFLFCLVLLLPGIRALIAFLTVFSLAHSVALSAFGYQMGVQPIWIPPLITTLGAAAIIYAGIDIIVVNSAPRRRWIAAMVSGLIFGLGFWFDLQPIVQFGGAHPVISVLSFNAGVELGQLVAVALLIAAVRVFFRLVGPGRINTIILAGLAVHLAWHRMVEGAAVLRRVPVQWPTFDSELPSRWLFGPIAAIGIVWLISTIVGSRRWGRKGRRSVEQLETEGVSRLAAERTATSVHVRD